jgi:hypothetical protein
MKTKIIILTALIISVLLFNYCGKTDLDREWEEILIGQWAPYNSDGERITTLPKYEFKENTRGATWTIEGAVDSLSWEITRKQIKVFYDNPPNGYFVAYDQYHIRSLYRVHEASQDEIELTMYRYGGYQMDFVLKRILPEEEGVIIYD